MSTMPSSPHTGKTDSIGWKLTSTDLGTVILASIFVLARLYTKAFIVRHVGWEDVLCVAALLVAIGRTALDIVAVKAWMLGHHIVDVSPSALQGEIIAVAVDGYLYVLAITLAKLSLLFFLYRIFSVSTRFRIASWTLGTIISVWALITILLGLFACKPLVAQFDFKLRYAPTTVCKPEPCNVEKVFGFCNILADFTLLLMPMPMLWRLQMATAKKVGLAVVFASGIFVCVLAILRQYMLYRSPFGADGSWQIIQIKVWMTVEVNICITCACLPVIQPLFRKVPYLISFLPSSWSAKFSGHSAMEKSSWARRLTGPRHDVEKGSFEGQRLGQRQYWREPDERSESTMQAMYHDGQSSQATLARMPSRPEMAGGREGREKCGEEV